MPDSTSGIQKISFTGRIPMDVYTMNLTTNGFDLTFTKQLDNNSATDTANYRMRRYRYEYKKKDLNEGIDDAPQVDVTAIPVTSIKLSNNRKKVSLSLGDLKPGFIYELTLGDIKSSDGHMVANKLICYTANRLKQ